MPPTTMPLTTMPLTAPLGIAAPQTVRTHRTRWRAAIGIAAVTALGASAAPAAAVEPALVTIPTVGGTTGQTWTYSSTMVDTQATVLLIDGYATAAGATVECTLNGAERPLTTETYPAAQWDPRGSVELAIPDGAFVDGLSNLTCVSRGATTYWEIVWYLDTYNQEGATNVIQQDDSRLMFYFNDTTFAAGPARQVAPGSTVLLAGPWEYGSEANDGYTYAALTSSDPRFDRIYLPVSYSETGTYGVVVQIPAELPPGFTDAPAMLAVESGSSGGGGNFSWRTTWSGTLTFDQVETSTTAVSVDRRYTVSRDRVTASAIVSTPAGTATGGTVDFFLNSRLVGSGSVDASGRASVVLPALPRGKHFIVATFRGTDAVQTSTSSAAFVRVLI